MAADLVRTLQNSSVWLVFLVAGLLLFVMGGGRWEKLSVRPKWQKWFILAGAILLAVAVGTVVIRELAAVPQ